MKFDGHKKTHYELVVDYVNKNKILGIIGYEDFVKAMEEDCGKNPSFQEFVTTEMVSSYAGKLENVQTATIVSNVLYHTYCLRQQQEKIYHVCSNMALNLSQTELNVDTYFLKSPFPEIFIGVDPGLFYIKSIVNEIPQSVHGFYVHLEEKENLKTLRVMAAALQGDKQRLEAGSQDALFYFKIELKPGKIKQSFQDYFNELIETKQEELRMFGGHYNAEYIEEIFYFIFNVLLYITSKEPDIVKELPIDFDALAKAKKNPSKARKILERKKKKTSLPIILIGKNAKSFGDADEIKKSGGVHNWKLDKRVYVSGHWRSQWYGSGDDKYQKLIYIEPYEKGPEMADIVHQRYKIGT